jgi:hypothetical protein
MKYNIDLMKSVWLGCGNQAKSRSMQFTRIRPFTAKQSINRALQLWVFLSSARREGLGGVRPGVNYNGKQPQSHNMITTSCQTVTLGMVLREADVHEQNGKNREAAKIRA